MKDKSLTTIWDIKAMSTMQHPNKVQFTGLLTYLDAPSDASPNGARGHKVLLTRGACEQALDSLIGMAVGFNADWIGHNARQKCGVITSAEIKGKKLLVSGFIYGKDFPEVVQQLEGKEEMGLSYELAESHVTDLRSPVWEINKTTFTGASILLRNKAAYRRTFIKLVKAA